jgi:prepilin-type N-terminal cleavage/methylation domain-containing protein
MRPTSLKKTAPKKSQLRKQQGFTLLEMLIAFSLVSLLFLALFSSFNTISIGWDAAENRMQKTEDQRLIMNWLRRQLQQVMVVRISDEKGKIYAFDGDESSIRYVAPMLPFKDKGGVYLQELFVSNEKGSKSLQLRYAPYRPDISWDEAFEEAEPVLVYDYLKSVQFEYFGSESEADDPRWESEWEDYPVYPLLFKLSIETEAGDAWPELVIDLPQVDEYLNTQFARSNRNPLARHHNAIR